MYNLKNDNLLSLKQLIYAACLVSLIPSFTFAQSLTITVFKNGQPLENASVCAGSKQQKVLFGKFLTDSQGKVSLSTLPSGKVIITVEDGFAGVQLPVYQNVSSQNLFLRIPAEENSIRCSDEN